jgi:hypothetical protein
LLNFKNKLNSSFLQAIREFHGTHVPEGYWIATLAMKFIVDCVTARKITADVAVQFLQVQFIVERVVINVGLDRPATLAMAMIECFVIARSAATQ